MPKAEKTSSFLLALMIVALLSLSGCITNQSLGLDLSPESKISAAGSENNKETAKETVEEFFSALKRADLDTINNLIDTGGADNYLLFGENPSEDELSFVEKSYEALSYEVNSIIEKDGLVLCELTINNIDLSKLDWKKYALEDALMVSVFDNADVTIVSSQLVLSLTVVEGVQKIQVDDDLKRVLLGTNNIFPTSFLSGINS